MWPFGRKAAPIHAGGGTQLVFLTNQDRAGDGRGYNYAREVGAGLGSSVVLAPVQWVQRAMMEAPLVVEMQLTDGEWECVDDHPLTMLLGKPNDYYAGTDLWSGTVLSYLTDGNAYWIQVPNRLGQPAELWYIPHWMMNPVGSRDGTVFIDHYEYTVRGKKFELPREEVVHFRHGIDPTNPRKGISPIASAIREIWSDMEAAEYMASILRNNGIPGLIITPDSDLVTLGPAEIADAKRYVTQRTTGSNRGEPMMFSGKTKVERVAWNPKEMDLSAATDRSEERVCSLLGIPAAVVGFSAGLETSKVGATMTQLRKLAWWNGVLPVQRVFAEAVSSALLPSYGETAGKRMQYDNDDVGALQEDADKVAKRADVGVRGGWLTVAQGKRMMGIDPLPGDDVYLRGIGIIAVPAGAAQAAPPPPAPEKGTKVDPPPQTLEERLARNSRRAPATEAQLAYIAIQESMAPKLEAKMRDALSVFFHDTLGARAAIAASTILAPKAGIDVDPLAASRIVDAMKMEDIVPIFTSIFENHYLLTAEESTSLAMDVMGLATGIPDPVARAIVATGGTRAGLIDLTQQTKDALFQAIEQGRAEGLGADALAARMRDMIEAGPWSSVEVRARVIARTETKYAQRVSTLHMARGQGVDQFRVFDARIGVTDPECEQLDGILVDAATADELAASEHPNGTRDFVPHFFQ